MEEVSVEVVLSEAGVNRENENDLTIFWHLKQFFGRSFIISEKKLWASFRHNGFPLEKSMKILQDKITIFN